MTFDQRYDKNKDEEVGTYMQNKLNIKSLKKLTNFALEV